MVRPPQGSSVRITASRRALRWTRGCAIPLVAACNALDPPTHTEDQDPACDEVVVVPDSDGDGFGPRIAPDPVLSCYDEIPVGFVEDRTDCDDTNPDVTPLAWEIAGDGIDSDCDGRVEGGCAAPWESFHWADSAVLRAGDCEPTDLALGAYSCSGCYEQMALLAVENRGDAEIEGNLRFAASESYTYSERQLTFAIPIALAPGERRLLFSGPLRGSVIATLGGAEVEYAGDGGTDAAGGTSDDEVCELVYDATYDAVYVEGSYCY